MTVVTSIFDFSGQALGELKSWLEPWFLQNSAQGGAAGELDYVQITSNVVVTATSEVTPTTVITGTSRDYANIPIIVEFGTPGLVAGTSTIVVDLWDGTTQLGRLALANPVSNRYPANPARAKFTPTAGPHQFIIKAFVDGGSGNVNAGDGSAGNDFPAYIRVTE